MTKLSRFACQIALMLLIAASSARADLTSDRMARIAADPSLRQTLDAVEAQYSDYKLVCKLPTDSAYYSWHCNSSDACKYTVRISCLDSESKPIVKLEANGMDRGSGAEFRELFWIERPPSTNKKSTVNCI